MYSLTRLVSVSPSLCIAIVLFQVLSCHCSNVFGKSNSLKLRNENSKKLSPEKGVFRDGRFFFVNFNQDLCTADSGESGVCMKSSACRKQGGTSGGTCAQGFGTCCLLTKACTGESQSITVNGTRLVQPVSGIGTTVDSCLYTIPKQAGVCQIRLDFTNFIIDEGPDAEFFGACSTDTLDISGYTNAKLGHLCGNLAGQHMYLEYGQNLNIDINIGLVTPNANQAWDILVTMIKCDSPNKAPPGCLQYFTTQRGKIQSFNFNVNKHQLNDQDYSVCVRNNPGMTKITWKTCTDDINDFYISGGIPAVCPPNPPPGCQPIGNIINGTSCMNDWVMIYGDNKYCGSYFPDAVSTTTQPFLLQVHFDAQELYIPNDPPPGFENDDSNTGFCLQYAQSSF